MSPEKGEAIRRAEGWRLLSTAVFTPGQGSPSKPLHHLCALSRDTPPGVALVSSPFLWNSLKSGLCPPQPSVPGTSSSWDFHIPRSRNQCILIFSCPCSTGWGSAPTFSLKCFLTGFLEHSAIAFLPSPRSLQRCGPWASFLPQVPLLDDLICVRDSYFITGTSSLVSQGAFLATSLATALERITGFSLTGTSSLAPASTSSIAFLPGAQIKTFKRLFFQAWLLC